MDLNAFEFLLKPIHIKPIAGGTQDAYMELMKGSLLEIIGHCHICVPASTIRFVAIHGCYGSVLRFCKCRILTKNVQSY